MCPWLTSFLKEISAETHGYKITWSRLLNREKGPFLNKVELIKTEGHNTSAHYLVEGLLKTTFKEHIQMGVNGWKQNSTSSRFYNLHHKKVTGVKESQVKSIASFPVTRYTYVTEWDITWRKLLETSSQRTLIDCISLSFILSSLLWLFSLSNRATSWV